MDEARRLFARQPRRRDARHLVERRDEAIDMTADFDAFAERKDVWVGGLHEPVDHDAAIDSQTRPRPKPR